MRQFYINSKIVTQDEFNKAYDTNQDASVYLRVDIVPKSYNPTTNEQPISAERAKAIREQYKSRE